MSSSSTAVRSRAARGGIAAVISTALLGLAACGGSEPSEASDDVTEMSVAIPLPAMEVGFAAIAVAENRGFFADEGLDVEVQFLKDSSGALQALAAGNVEIASATPDTIFAARDKGQDVKLVHNSTRRSNQYYATLPGSGIDDVDDLLGKKIGVSSLESGAKKTSTLALGFAGHSDDDVEYVAVGLGAPALDSLQRGRVDALAMWAEAYQDMENAGGKLEYLIPETTQNLFGTGFATSSTVIEESPEVVEKFGRAWSRATYLLVQDPEGAVEDVWELYPNTKTGADDLAQVADTLRGSATRKYEGEPETFDEWGAYDESAVATWVEAAAMVGLTEGQDDVSDVYTNEFVEAYNDFDRAEVCDKCAP